MRDERPLRSPTPPAAAELGQQLVDRLKADLDATVDAIVALPGNPAERENDALSLVATVGGFVGLQLSARLMRLKRIDPENAMAISMGEISERMTAEFVRLIFGQRS